MKTILFFAALILSCAPARAEVRYTIVPIEKGFSGPARRASFGLGVNSRGEATGYFQYASEDLIAQVFRFSLAEGMVDLGPHGVGRAINNAGQIAGGGNRAFRWSSAKGIEPFGSKSSQAISINASGQMTGWTTGADGYETAFLFTDETGMQELESGQIGVAINDQGWITGADDQTAYVFRPGLETLYLGPGMGTAINNQGAVAGDYGYPWFSDPVLWINGETRFLGGLGGNLGCVYGMNNRNQVVGFSSRADQSGPGFLWTEEEGMVDLHSLVASDCGWFIGDARAINDNGWIVGDGYYENRTQAYLLVPIPPTVTIEPAKTNVVVSWTPAWPDAVLETQTGGTGDKWTPVPTGGTNRILLPAASPCQLFRVTRRPPAIP